MSQIYFAWVTETDTTWTETFKRKDEQIASIDGAHSENNFPTLNMVIKNPRVGLLAPGRYVWGWFAYEADDTAGTVIPFYFGQLVGIPDDLLGESLTLSFVAKAKDFDVQKMNVALSMMTAPNYDPIFIDPEKRPLFATDGTMRGEPDVVLEGWPKLWHFDRTTLAVSASHVLVGEDGTESFAAGEIPRASVQLRRGTAPLSAITVIGDVNWTQADNGVGIDFGTKTFSAFNGTSIISSWPQTGAQLSGGWGVVEGWALDVLGLQGAQTIQSGYRYENKEHEHKNEDIMSLSWEYATFPPCNGITYTLSESHQPHNVTASWEHILPAKYDEQDQNVPQHDTWEIMLIAEVLVQAKLVLGWAAGIKRTENITFKLSADVQPVLVSPDPADVTETVTIRGSDVGVPINGTAPIPSASAYNFFPTTRGKDAREYLLCVGMNHLKMRSRAVTVTWDTTFERALALSCRKNATIADERLPGGTATGKIIAYSFSASGSQMQFKGSVTIGCCIGHGGTVSAAAGTPAIFEAGVVEAGLQAYTNSTIAIGNEFTYPALVYEAAANELQFPLTKEQVLVSETIDNSGTMFVNVGQYAKVEVPTSVYRLELKSLTGLQDHIYDLTANPLKLPKQIDLEAASWV